MYDVIIIGGGPAGLTAGLYTSRARLKSLLIEKGFLGGQVMTTEWIENYPGFEDGISGVELSQKMEKQATKFGLEIMQGSVTGVSLDGKTKKVKLEDGSELEAKSIILATGSNPKPLSIKGEEEFRGRGVSYCATCDAAFFKESDLAVIGGGDSAVEEGIFLTKFAKTVYIVHRRDQLRATKVVQERAFENPKIKMVWDSVPEEIVGDATGVTSLKIKNVKTGEVSELKVQGVFIYIGYNPNIDPVKDIITINESNYAVANENMATSGNGIFAAGDVRAKPLKQIATAVGDGATAAISAEKYIEENF
ncbi:thioredoxin reductase [bacterium BMS3Bbin09]|nr:thioredoxin reductase [bacterium BMS3Bbin09]HDH33833.1 thioredoxin-disulfide reductase [Nitrospirota bacterium]HDN94518.1 thioredoxin-disulfide reductase [Nitrospirota bacterium]